MSVLIQATGPPGAALLSAVREEESADSIELAFAKTATVAVTTGLLQVTFAVVLPVFEIPSVVRAVAASIFALAAQFAVFELAFPDIAGSIFVAALAMELVVLKLAQVMLAVAAAVKALAGELAVREGAAEHSAGIAAGALAIGLATDKPAFIADALRLLQLAGAVVAAVLEFPFVVQAWLAVAALAVEAALLEMPFIDASSCVAETSLATEQSVFETAFVAVTISALPDAVAMLLPILE